SVGAWRGWRGPGSSTRADRASPPTARPDRCDSTRRASTLRGILALVAQGIEHRFPKPGVAGSNPAEGASRATCAHRTAQVFLNLVSPAALQAAPPRPFGPLPRPSRGRNPSCRGRLHSNLCSIPFGAVITALRLTAHRSAQVFLNLVSPAALQAAPPRPFGPLPRPSRGRNPMRPPYPAPAALQAAPPRPFGPLPRPSRGRNPSCRGRLSWHAGTQRSQSRSGPTLKRLG